MTSANSSESGSAPYQFCFFSVVNETGVLTTFVYMSLVRKGDVESLNLFLEDSHMLSIPRISTALFSLHHKRLVISRLVQKPGKLICLVRAVSGFF